MDETESPNTPSLRVEQDEVSVLDLLETIAENIRLLVVGPFLVGLSALGLGYMAPQSYESVALLQSDQAPISLLQATVSLTGSAAVLDPMAIKLGLTKSLSIEDSRNELRGSINATIGRTDKLLTLTTSGPTPQQAQAKAYALLEQIYIQSGPKGALRERLERQLAEASERLKSAENVADILLKRLDVPVASATAGNELSRGYAELLKVSGDAQAQIVALKAQLEVLSEDQLIQKPTLPEKASQPRKARLAIGATLVAGLMLLIFVFVRQALGKAAVDTRAYEKLANIKRALGLKVE